TEVPCVSVLIKRHFTYPCESPRKLVSREKCRNDRARNQRTGSGPCRLTNYWGRLRLIGRTKGNCWSVVVLTARAPSSSAPRAVDAVFDVVTPAASIRVGSLLA